MLQGVDKEVLGEWRCWGVDMGVLGAAVLKVGVWGVEMMVRGVGV